MPHDSPTPHDDPAATRSPLGFNCVPALDPIDAAIERHRAAWNELGIATRAVDAAMSATRQAEAEARADAAFDAASAADGAAWADLLATRPRDVPGAVRLLRYVSASPASEIVEDPQDLLRKLTAAVEAAEAGEASNGGAPAAGERAVAAETDPVFAVIAEFRAAWDALTQAHDAADGAEVPAVVVEAVCAAHDQLRAVRPTTAAGFRALAETWAWRLREERATPATGHEGVGTTIEAHAADSLIAGAGVCAPSAPVRDWEAFAAGHPGFVPYPPHAPVLLMALDEAIPREAERLLDLAEAEIARSLASYAGCPDPNLWSQVERTLRRELRTEALEMVARPPKDDGAPDPVLALIEAHRTAYVAWDRASKVWTDMVPGEPGYAAAQAAAVGPGKRECAAYRRLFSARPTTLAGAVALASYLGEAIRRTRIDPDPTDGERALSTITAALHGLAPGGAFSGDAPATVSAPHPDEALFALGADFLVAWVAEARIGDAAAYEAATAIAARIVETPATTVAGLGIKALLLARLNSGDSSPLDPEPPQGPAGSFWNVLRQVQEGAARFGGAAGVGRAGEATAQAERDAADLDASTLVAAIEAEWAVWSALDAAAPSDDHDPAFEAAHDRRGVLLDAAAALPSNTREARHAKALALAWLHYVSEWQRDRAYEDYSLDGQLALDIDAGISGGEVPRWPAGLAAACAWAAEREARINAPGGTDGMNEAQLDAALKAYDRVWDRAITEPSASPADVAAKARLLLPDAERRARSAEACRDDRLVPVILREIAGLGDAT